jgi:hypothetical protein
MQKKKTPKKEFTEFKRLKIPEFLGSEYCPENLRKLYEVAKRTPQVDGFPTVDAITAGLISEFLFWLSGWVWKNIPKIVSLFHKPEEEAMDTRKVKQNEILKTIEDLFHGPLEVLAAKIEARTGKKPYEYVTVNLVSQYLTYEWKKLQLPPTEIKFLVFWDKTKDFASDLLGIYVKNQPQFVNYDIFISKFMELSYSEIYSDIETFLEIFDKKGLEKLLRPFFHPREGAFILYEKNRSVRRPGMKDVFSPSVETLLSYAIHECIGHGFFYRHTALGEKLSSEKAIQAVMFERVESTSEIKPEKEMQELRLLREETYLVREGFALWIQLYLLKKLNEYPDFHLDGEIKDVTRLVSEESVIKSDSFSAGFHLFKKIEENYGQLCVPRALQIACNMRYRGDFIQRLVNISETLERIDEEILGLEFRKNDLNWFDYAVDQVWNYKLPPIQFLPAIRFSYIE